MANRSGLSHLLASSKWELLKEKYGENPDTWKAAGAMSLIGADLVDGASAVSNSNIKANNIAKRQTEVANRADVSLLNISKQGKQLTGIQKGHFIKSGVKLEGSALDVIQETIHKANDAMIIKQQEADFESSQLEIEKRLQRAKGEAAQVQTLLSIGSTLASI
jgi:hypothetical protein